MTIARILALAAATLFTTHALADGAPEIVGGKPTPDGRYPWMVPLLDAMVPDNYNALQCGGSLIDSTHVLTAAHCINFMVYDVLIGSQDLKSCLGRRVRVRNVTVHPKYNLRTKANDVAVLELAQPVTDVAPVRFITTLAEETQYMPDAKMLTVMGYGHTRAGGQASPVQREVKVPVVNRVACNTAPMYPKLIGDTEFCAGYAAGGKDSCQGDSGGPIISRGKTAQADVQVGVVSWSAGCADPDKPGVYARLGTVGEWVKAQITQP